VVCPLRYLDYRCMFCKGTIPFQKSVLRNDAFPLTHTETASSANEALRHRAVCIIRLMTGSTLDVVDSSFQSNAGALLEHSAVS